MTNQEIAQNQISALSLALRKEELRVASLKHRQQLMMAVLCWDGFTPSQKIDIAQTVHCIDDTEGYRSELEYTHPGFKAEVARTPVSRF